MGTASEERVHLGADDRRWVGSMCAAEDQRGSCEGEEGGCRGSPDQELDLVEGACSRNDDDRAEYEVVPV